MGSTTPLVPGLIGGQKMPIGTMINDDTQQQAPQMNGGLIIPDHCLTITSHHMMPHDMSMGSWQEARSPGVGSDDNEPEIDVDSECSSCIREQHRVTGQMQSVSFNGLLGIATQQPPMVATGGAMIPGGGLLAQVPQTRPLSSADGVNAVVSLPTTRMASFSEQRGVYITEQPRTLTLRRRPTITAEDDIVE